MVRSILLSSVLAFLYFTGCASQASANISEYTVTPTLPGATIDFAGTCFPPLQRHMSVDSRTSDCFQYPPIQSTTRIAAICPVHSRCEYGRNRN